MNYPHDRTVWDRMMNKQKSLLGQIEGVSIEGEQYIDSPAPYRLGINYPGYMLPGYLLVQMNFNFPAIMDCRATPTQKTAHRLTSTNQVRISANHTVQLLIPRTFNKDPIGWGIRFVSEPPMYPNIVCADLDTNDRSQLKFSQYPHPMADLLPGLVCIGASQDRENPAMPYVLISDLKNYLDMSDPARWKGMEQGGANDYGFEKNLFDHMSQNYDVLRKAIQEFNPPTPVPTPGPRKKLGKKRERRKLGK
jgi:hypothetical protein